MSRAVRSQIQGSVVQGLGYALHEKITLNAGGAIDQASFESHRIPLAEDAVPVEIEFFKGAPSIGPLGTKSAGEGPILHVGATVPARSSTRPARPYGSCRRPRPACWR